MTMLSFLYGIIMDRKINTPGHGNSFVDGLNATDKLYLRGEMELIGRLESKDTRLHWILRSMYTHYQ